MRLIINELKKSKKFNTYFCITGKHFNKNYGYSFNEVKKYIKPDFKINIDIEWTNESKLNNSIIGFQKRLRTLIKMINADYILVLGDRVELLAIINLKLIMDYRIIHISGGEETEGAIDNYIRKMLSLVSDIHFTSNRMFRKNVKKIAINKQFIYNVGDPILELIKHTKLKSLNEINEQYKLNLKNKKFILCTFHPETNTKISIKEQFEGVKEFLLNTNMHTLCTAPNGDNGSHYIMKQLKYIAKNNNKIHFIEHLGFENYISLLKYAYVNIGNSSSIIIESPAMKTVSILIGERQRGRPLAGSIIKSNYDFLSIKNSFDMIDDYYRNIDNIKLIYQIKNTSKLVRKKLEKII